MNPAELAGWIGTATALGGYAWSVRAKRPIVFHWANATGSIGIAASAAAAHAWPNLVLTVAFGCIGVTGIVQHWRNRNVPVDTRRYGP